MADAPKPKLRWFQYSLRSLLLLTLLVSIGMSWVAVKLQPARRQQAAVQAIRLSGGSVSYDSYSGPAWLRRLLGDDLCASVIHVDVRSDVGLEYLGDLPQLKGVRLSGTGITDAGLKHLKGLTQLKGLSFYNTKISDAGLEYLEGLTQLTDLELSGSEISDAGLEHLKGLTQLNNLGLRKTKISG